MATFQRAMAVTVFALGVFGGFTIIDYPGNVWGVLLAAYIGAACGFTSVAAWYGARKFDHAPSRERLW